ncbi:type 2 isopentenyl-diphosphate Delta-isomerase [Moorella sulfitireducens (nom. illeg.)]|uniref:type 2 isopentenyl-diphosphate Delta-isomerase n=1 Tax=Neomoorella sulfitireducens TaxID=2972948 RepID=UPI0021AC95E4|nr:type 2 isopentenyl-diphosphate Delta-isomerase [Moorella sulfitireducens]
MPEIIAGRGRRKLEHLRFFQLEGNGTNGLEDVHLIHQALPELDWQDIDLSCRWLGKTLAAPFIINALTGGPPETIEINAALARVARRTGIAMAVGSQRGAIENKAWMESFTITRRENPEGLLLANVGAGNSPEDAREAVAMIAADGLQVHLNAAQELVMPEGDRSFRGWLENIKDMVNILDVPVIAKEVGFGLSREAALQLYNCGVRIFDVGGRGGTDFAAIENKRRDRQVASLAYWGLPTAVSILEIKELSLPVEIVATGGIRSVLDAARALALGAKIVGAAGHFLKILLERGEDALVQEIFDWQEDLKRICLLTGCSTPAELATRRVVITGKTKAWLEGIQQRPLRQV